MSRVLTSIEALPELEVDDGRVGALDVHLRREIDDRGPVLLLTTPEGRTEIRPWGTPGTPT